MNTSREFVKRVYDTFEETGSLTKTAEILGTSRETITYWVRQPAKFDPYLDDIAIERALLGERKVFENLTRWEEMEVLARLGDILDSQEDHLLAGKIYDLYTEAWGIPNDTLRKRILRLRGRARSAA